MQRDDLGAQQLWVVLVGEGEGEGEGEGGRGTHVVPGEDVAGDSGGVFPGCGGAGAGQVSGGGGGGEGEELTVRVQLVDGPGLGWAVECEAVVLTSARASVIAAGGGDTQHSTTEQHSHLEPAQAGRTPRGRRVRDLREVRHDRAFMRRIDRLAGAALVVPFERDRRPGWLCVCVS